MWVLGSQNDDEHNVRLVAAQQTKGKGDDDLLIRLIDEMSFWNSSSHTPEKVHEGGQNRRRPRSTNEAWTATSAAGSLSSSDTHYDTRGELNSRNKNEKEKSSKEVVWKTAVDPATGQTYYYDSISRTSQWEKPAELRALEKQRKEERRRNDELFFKEMEKNILSSLEKGELIPGLSTILTKDSAKKPGESFLHIGPPREPKSPPLGTTNHICETPTSTSGRVRTISAMDEVLLAELQRDTAISAGADVRNKDDLPPRQMEHILPKSGRPPLPTGTSRRDVVEDDDALCSMELSPDPVQGDKMAHPFHRDGVSMIEAISSPMLTHEDALAGESLLDEPIQDETALIAEIATVTPNARLPKALHARRNTGGTIYLQNTIYNPDIQATITCVCGVYRAHVVQAVENDVGNVSAAVVNLSDSDLPDTLNVKVFRDKRGVGSRTTAIPSVPSLSDILTFYQEFYQRSKMEQDTIIMSLIYVERLIKATNGVLAPCPENWRSILFACMVLASKVWDDLSMWNIDFSNVSAATAGLSAFTLSRINQLELALLKALNFDVRVPAGEYAKYYFLIRTMLLRSGLMQENSKPLQRKKDDDASFSKLENLTTKYQLNTLPKPTADGNVKNSTMSSNTKEGISRPEPIRYRVQSLDGAMTFLNAGNKPGPVLRDTVCLEQLMG
jgi:hypothetical protein